MSILYILLVLLIVTRLFGELAERFKQPALLGELISGICLGMLVHRFDATFPILAGLADNEVFQSLTDLGIFFLMLLGGIELHPAKLMKASKNALWIAFAGMVLPLGIGVAFGYVTLPETDLKSAQLLFLGTAMAVTAVPVSIKALMDLGKLETEVGQIIVSAAVIDDILSLVLLAVLTSFISTGTVPDLTTFLLIAGKIGLFFIIAGLLGKHVFPRLGKLVGRGRADEFEFSMLLIAGLAYALMAEALGMHFIIGAFIAGLFFRKSTISEDVYQDTLRKVSGLTTGFFAPIFFASIGMHLDTSALIHIPGFILGLILIATLGKLLGAGLSARMSGLSNTDALAIGAGMNARGAVELIIADIALRAGIFDLAGRELPIISNMFSAVVIMALVTTLMTPPALKWLMADRKNS
ncbi:MAG: cation:proton antiporter [Desulfuromonas sp.]|nr:MAG: cation:proton antiporter [Desulfuromonas sp.]